MIVISLVLLALSLVIFLQAIYRSQRQGFYTNTPLLVPMGIYVWGDGMILGPFWATVSLVALWLNQYLTIINLVQFYLLFIAIRSAYEVIYWINHQVAQRDYRPPLFRSLDWIGPNEAAILYQLINTCWVILAVAGLVISFIYG